MRSKINRFGVGLILITAVVVTFTAQSPAAPSPAKADPADVAKVVEGNNAFAFDLYARLSGPGEANLIYSPYSISTALAIAYAGARGKTAEEMAQVLHFGPPNEKLHPAMGQLMDDFNQQGGNDYKLVTANRLWGQKGYKFLDSYVNLINASYSGAFETVDYKTDAKGARKTINRWVEKQTNNKIKDLIGPNILNPLTRLVITNAIYFKGKWDSEFKKDATRDAPFKLMNGKQVQVPLMYQKHEFKIGQGPGCQLLEMPYKGGELSMVVILPDQDDGLPEVEKALNAGALAEWMKSLYSDEVMVYLPRFKATFKVELAKTLKGMGMISAFDDSADFSGLNGATDLKITNVIHQAYVDVNEEGTEAAAATAVVVGIKSAAPPRNIFRADHPFLFLIRDQKTGAILFMGRVMNPKP